ALARRAVGRPARMADAANAFQWMLGQKLLQVAQLALGAPAREDAVFQGSDAGRIIAAIFEPFERIDQPADGRFFPEYANDSAHDISRCDLCCRSIFIFRQCLSLLAKNAKSKPITNSYRPAAGNSRAALSLLLLFCFFAFDPAGDLLQLGAFDSQCAGLDV